MTTNPFHAIEKLEADLWAAVLWDMKRLISTLNNMFAKIRAIKQGMMQQLLTGRVRLVRPQAEEVRA